jgi:hypothetical protein
MELIFWLTVLSTLLYLANSQFAQCDEKNNMARFTYGHSNGSPGPPVIASKFKDRATWLHYSPVVIEEQNDGLFFHIFGTVTEFHFPY